WTIAAAVLYILLPDQLPLPFIRFLGIFLLAQVAGVVSNVPGGLGVFEAVCLVFLAPYYSASQILGALVAFRCTYYLLPLFEAPRFFATLGGAALLLLARGLQRRLAAAYRLTVIVLSGGIFLQLLKGGDYEEAIILSIMLFALVASRRHFVRKASLVSEAFGP